MTTQPSEHVLDLFAVPNDVKQLGNQCLGFRAGDLIFSPSRDSAVQDWLSPVLARLAFDLDTQPSRHRRDLRVAMPVPARNGEWVVDGWTAHRYEPGSRPLHDLSVVRAVGALLHAELATRVASWPAVAQRSSDRVSWAAAAAFGDIAVDIGNLGAADELVRALLSARDLSADLGPHQLVHGDLASSVLLDADDIPIVVGLTPHWRPPLWADAVCVFDYALLDPDDADMDDWTAGVDRQAMIRAALFRLLADPAPDVDTYLRVVAAMTP